MSISNVERILSFNGTVQPNAYYESDKITLQAFSGMNFSCYFTAPFKMIIYFSNDSINWDITVTHNWKNLTDGYSCVIYGLYMKYRLINLDLYNPIDVRLSAYCSVQATTSVVYLGQFGNYNQKVDIGNLPKSVFGELTTSELKPKVQYIFNRGTSGIISSSSYKTPYPNIKAYANDLTSTLTFNNGVMQFGILSENTVGKYQSLSGDNYSYRAGQSFFSRFTASFFQDLKTGSSTPRYQFAGIGNLNASNAVLCGCGFGFNDSGVWNTSKYELFGIHYIINSGSSSFIQKNSWNVDKCDGSGRLPILDFSYFQLFEIEFAYLGYGRIIFKIYNPNTGDFDPVHIINRVNTGGYSLATNFINPSFSICLFQQVGLSCVPISSFENISLGSFMCGIYGNQPEAADTYSYSNTKTCSAGVETTIINLRCLSGSWYGVTNSTPVDVGHISASVDGTKNSTINIYMYGSLGGLPVWSSPFSDYQPLEKDTSGTRSGGLLLVSYNLGKADNIQIDLTDIHIHIDKGVILSVTCLSSANTDCFVSLACHIH